jgi:hypothetical protein
MRNWLVLLTVATVVGVVATPLHASPPNVGPEAKSVRVPNVHCRRLDVAEDIMHGHHLRTREVGGGVFGIVVKSNWFVTRQRPVAGARVARRTRVSLYVAREC